MNFYITASEYFEIHDVEREEFDALRRLINEMELGPEFDILEALALQEETVLDYDLALAA